MTDLDNQRFRELWQRAAADPALKAEVCDLLRLHLDQSRQAIAAAKLARLAGRDHARDTGIHRD